MCRKWYMLPLMEREMMTTVEVAAEFGVTVKTINEWVKRGRLTPDFTFPTAKGGRLYRPETIEALAAERDGAKS